MDDILALAKGGLAKPTRTHSGAIHSSVAGRTDHLPMTLQAGSYVIPADIISALGEGNTNAGFKVAKSIFSSNKPYGQRGLPYGAKGLPYGMDSPRKADGGPVEGVPIVAAGGEYVIDPASVAAIGEGDIDVGHAALDQFVKTMRKKTIAVLKALPGPKAD